MRDRAAKYREDMEDLFGRWGGEGSLVRDGVIDPEVWFDPNREGPRILFLLKEAYGSGVVGDGLLEMLRGDGPAFTIWRRVSEWACGLMGTTASHLEPFREDGECKRCGNRYLSSSAVVNVKKSDGRKESSYEEILACAEGDAALLKEELEICDPTVIVCGYTARPLEAILGKGYRVQPSENLFYSIELNGHPVIVLDYWHPSYRVPKLMAYYGLVGIYQAALSGEEKRRQIAAALEKFPDPQYSPMVFVGDSEEVLGLLDQALGRCSSPLQLCAADASAPMAQQHDCLVVHHLEGIEHAPEQQRALADSIEQCALRRLPVVILSDKPVHSMSIDGRLRSRSCSGVTVA